MSDHSSLIDEAARRRFESARADGKPASLDAFLPRPDDPRFLPTLEELVLIDIEFGWKHQSTTPAPPPVVETYLARFPQLARPDILLRLVKEEYRVRHRHGDAPPAADYQRRFPDLGAVAAQLETVAHQAAKGAPDDTPPAPAGYEIRGVVGYGGMGVVYEAFDPRLGRTVALKTVRHDIKSAEARARFLAEAQVAARLEHPGIVPVHELVTPPDGPPFYTMKQVHGQTLADAIRAHHDPASTENKVLGRRRLREAFLTVTRTMAFAHSRGVIHRDLKPANIILGEYGETVILDWGLAKVLRGDKKDDAPAGKQSGVQPAWETVPGDVLGTPAYMSPEQAGGRTAEVDERSDIYALGAILYQILTGVHPHADSGASVLLNVIQAREPTRPRALVPDMHPALDAICMKALAARREDRYPTATALAADLERFQAGEPVSAYRESFGERLGRWARRNRTLVALGAVALMLSAVGLLAVGYFRERAEFERQKQLWEFERQHEVERQR